MLDRFPGCSTFWIIQQNGELRMKQRKRKPAQATLIVLAVTALVVLGAASSASAKLVGEFTKFEQCPWTTEGVNRCIYSVTGGGEVVLGKKKVPIVNPVTLQGGYAKPVEGFSKFFEAKNTITLSKAAQPVPGGLAGLVNCKEISNTLLRISCELTFENGFTGVNSTLELARPASEIQVSEINLASKEGVALKLPVRVHLENPFLGGSCYVGSSTSPIPWELTTGITAPSKPNEPIEGSSGTVEFLEGGRILHLDEAVLVDNNWPAPKATGCGGFLVELLVNPIINASVGLPSAAGLNTAVLKNSVYTTTAAALKKVDSENP